MNLFSAAERLAAIDHSAVQLDTSRCLLSLDQFATCHACQDICPVQALGAPAAAQAGAAAATPGAGAAKPGAAAPKKGPAGSGGMAALRIAVVKPTPPVLNEKACVSCLACLPACPMGAFSADDALRSLLNCAPRLPEGQVELLCPAHPASGGAHPGTGVAIRVRGCLAGIGPGALAALAAVGFPTIRLRVDACSTCDLGAANREDPDRTGLEAQIRAQAEAAQHAMTAFDDRPRVVVCGEPGEDEAVSAPLWDANNPPLSRRDLFRFGGRSGQLALGRAFNPVEPGPSAPRGSLVGHPPRERQRLISAFAHLGQAAAGHPSGGASLAGLGFFQVHASEACDACGACARACPHGALLITKDEKASKFELAFVTPHCTGCEICIHVCAPGAITVKPAVDFASVYPDPPEDSVLASDSSTIAGEGKTIAGEEKPAGEEAAAAAPRVRQPGEVILKAGGLIRCDKCNGWIAASESRLCMVCAYRKKNPFGSALPPGLAPEILAGVLFRKPRSDA